MQGILGRERQRLLRQDRRASLRWCDLRFVKTFLRRVNLLDAEAARMIIYRIQAVAPEKYTCSARTMRETAKIQEAATPISRIIRLS
jgi:hypothetical protein